MSQENTNIDVSEEMRISSIFLDIDVQMSSSVYSYNEISKFCLVHHRFIVLAVFIDF